MSEETLGPKDASRVRRLPKKAEYTTSVIYEILDAARLCHLGAVVNDVPVAMPTLHAREDSVLYVHGSQSNAAMKSVLAMEKCSLSVTVYEGIRAARSGFESSISYRSVVAFGRAEEVTDLEEKRRILDLMVDAVLPGRASEVRPMTERELNLTLVIKLPIDEASAKVSGGPPEDFPEDLDLPIWAGEIPARTAFSAPIPNTDGAMATGTIPVPASVERLLRDFQ